MVAAGVGIGWWRVDFVVLRGADPERNWPLRLLITMVDNLSTVVSIKGMARLVSTAEFVGWLDNLRDGKGRAIILARLTRLALGHAGDAKPVGGGVSELRIAFGPGYRIYFMRRGPVLVVVLAGGDKSSQSRDIETAKLLAAEWKD